MQSTLQDRQGGSGDQPRALLEALQVSLVYKTKSGTIEALKDLSFALKEREFVAVLGPSGCGKSTFLNIAAGLLPPSSGQVFLNGLPTTKPRPDVGVVFQQPMLIPWKNVLKNVLITAQCLNLNIESSRLKALELLRLVGLENFAENYPFELSGGMQQRVGLVRGLVHDPAVLLMDEPFAALDAMTRERMTLELQKLWMTTGKSVVFITHSIPEAVFLADRVIVLSERPGRVIEEVAVTTPRPRDIETMATPEFAELCKHLRMQFSDILSIQ